MEEELEEDRASVDAAELRARRGCGDRWRGGTWGAAAATELAMAMGGEALRRRSLASTRLSICR